MNTSSCRIIFVDPHRCRFARFEEEPKEKPEDKKVAENLLKKGVPVAEITEATGLQEKEILSLLENDADK